MTSDEQGRRTGGVIGAVVGAGRTVAVVPVKGLGEAKSRLAGALGPDERSALTLHTMRGVLDALDVPGIAARLVVSPDPTVLATARATGARGLLQRSPSGGNGHGGGRDDGLNRALDEARRHLVANGAGAMLVVLGDLPLLSAADVGAMLALADEDGDEGMASSATVVLAPDRRESGTNALLLRPLTGLPFAFGAGSLARHRAAARGLRLRLYRAPGTALDLDTPDDLAALRAVAGGGAAGPPAGGFTLQSPATVQARGV